MEKTTDRPLVEGHAATCRCSTCTTMRGAQLGPTRSAPSGWAAPASHHPDLSTDYLRRIHWWVRLAGIIWIVIPIVLAVLAAVFLVGAAANSSGAGY